MTDTDLTPRERVARAILTVPVGPLGPNALATVNQGGSTYLTSREAQDMADAALAALADHPGLVEVLREHVWWPTSWTCACETVGRTDQDTLAAHLADVVRAWLRGAS